MAIQFKGAKIQKLASGSGSSKSVKAKQIAELEKQKARKITVKAISVPAEMAVGKWMKAEATQFSPSPTDAEKGGVCWIVEFEGRVVEKFVNRGPVLQYQVPFFLIDLQGTLKGHTASTFDPQYAQRLEHQKAKRIALVNKKLTFKAYIGNEADAVSKPVDLKPNYDRFDKIRDYMFDEVSRNARGTDAQYIRGQLANEDRYRKLASKELAAAAEASKSWTGFLRVWGHMETHKAYVNQAMLCHGLAMKRFYDKVKEDSDWDHKGSLQKRFGTNTDAFIPFRGDVANEYFHDIWSNVHYGYVGRAAGLDERTLMYWGAEVSGWSFGDNDEGDKISVQLGLDLWKAHGLNLTKDQLVQAILAAKGKFQSAAGKDPDNKKIMPVRNGY